VALFLVVTFSMRGNPLPRMKFAAKGARL